MGRRRSVSQRRERIDKWGRLGGIRADESCCALRNDWQLIMKIQEGSPTCSAKLPSLLFSFHTSYSVRTLMSTNTLIASVIQHQQQLHLFSHMLCRQGGCRKQASAQVVLWINMFIKLLMILYFSLSDSNSTVIFNFYLMPFKRGGVKL